MKNIQLLKCYPQVAIALGRGRAKVELAKVLRSGIKFKDCHDIIRCFCWSESPQGHMFWVNTHLIWRKRPCLVR